MSADEFKSNGKRNFYNNRNGCLEVEEVLIMMMNGTWDNYLRTFKTTTHKCNIKGMKPDSVQCFHCSECFENTTEGVREYKDYYKLRGIKYLKADLINQTMPGLSELEVK